MFALEPALKDAEEQREHERPRAEVALRQRHEMRWELQRLAVEHEQLRRRAAEMEAEAAAANRRAARGESESASEDEAEDEGAAARGGDAYEGAVAALEHDQGTLDEHATSVAL